MDGEAELTEQDPAVEIVDGVVVREVRTLPAVRSRPVVVAQAAAVAATSFVAGAATLAVVSRRRSAPRRKPAVRRPKPAPVLDVVATRTYLVEIHQLGPR